MKARVNDMRMRALDGSRIELSIALDVSYGQEVYELVKASEQGERGYVVEVSKPRKKRSLSANSYLWVLCDKIAKVIGTTKETVYIKNIREVGCFDVLEIADNAVDGFINRWKSMGIGNYAETVGYSYKGYTGVIAYYGSSGYDTKEMSRLIESVVQEAKTLGIETLSDDELERMKSSWKG